jgi:DNA mismatch endonuclease, patch repair protein
MKRMRRAGTGPELAIRTLLHVAGARYRVNLSCLPGSPDIAFTRARLACFIDGCFWHRCPEHSVLPKNNAEWWECKLHATVERDRRKDDELEALGWRVLHIWEHEDPADATARILHSWRSSLD